MDNSDFHFDGMGTAHIQEERKLYKIYSSAVRSYKAYTKSLESDGIDNLGAKIDCIMELYRMQKKVKSGQEYNIHQNRLRKFISTVIENLDEMVEPENKTNAEIKKDYWLALGELAKCFDKGKITLDVINELEWLGFSGIAIDLLDCLSRD